MEEQAAKVVLNPDELRPQESAKVIVVQEVEKTLSDEERINKQFSTADLEPVKEGDKNYHATQIQIKFR